MNFLPSFVLPFPCLLLIFLPPSKPASSLPAPSACPLSKNCLLLLWFIPSFLCSYIPRFLVLSIPPFLTAFVPFFYWSSVLLYSCSSVPPFLCSHVPLFLPFSLYFLSLFQYMLLSRFTDFLWWRYCRCCSKSGWTIIVFLCDNSTYQQALQTQPVQVLPCTETQVYHLLSCIARRTLQNLCRKSWWVICTCC